MEFVFEARFKMGLWARQTVRWRSAPFLLKRKMRHSVSTLWVGKVAVVSLSVRRSGARLFSITGKICTRRATDGYYVVMLNRLRPHLLLVKTAKAAVKIR